ncbi:hypothetical protein BJX70DRAFT_401518 [Aspergillus crustosus]
MAADPTLAAPIPVITDPPEPPSDVLARLLRRDSNNDTYPVSICGWIDGDGGKPAYCSTRSSCAWNTDNNYIGCCATASSTCRFYTSCVDASQPAPTEDSENVFTCLGDARCYRNTYPDEFYQWGCGDPDNAATVYTSYDGINPDLSLQVAYTGTAGDSTSTSTSTSISTETTATTTATVSRADAEQTPAGSIATDTNNTSGLSTGAKAGVGVGAAVGCLLLFGVIAFFVLRWRKKRGRGSSQSEVEKTGVFYEKDGAAKGPDSIQVPLELDATGHVYAELDTGVVMAGDGKKAGDGQRVGDGQRAELPG